MPDWCETRHERADAIPGGGERRARVETERDAADALPAGLVSGGRRQLEVAVGGTQLTAAELELDVATVVVVGRIDPVTEVLAELAHVRHRLGGRDICL